MSSVYVKSIYRRIRSDHQTVWTHSILEPFPAALSRIHTVWTLSGWFADLDLRVNWFLHKTLLNDWGANLGFAWLRCFTFTAVTLMIYTQEFLRCLTGIWGWHFIICRLRSLFIELCETEVNTIEASVGEQILPQLSSLKIVHHGSYDAGRLKVSGLGRAIDSLKSSQFQSHSSIWHNLVQIGWLHSLYLLQQ